MSFGGGTVTEDEFRRALGYGTLALDLLRRASVPPHPQFYELFYTYATGVNPALNARINAIFRDGDPSRELTERLCREFMSTVDATERITSVSQRMSHRIDTMNDAIDSAMTTANAYAAALQIAGGDLGTVRDTEALRAMANSLLGETRRMQEANAELERNLDASRDDIASLQRDLDDVRREALLDPLTKVYNRKAFDDGIARAVSSAASDGSPLCLILLDIDHFKRFNDTWGHQTGDQVLRLVAMTLKSNIKGQDSAARYGGEEFAAILPQTGIDGAVLLAEKIRKAVQAKELLKRSTNEKLGHVTASVGVAMFRAGDTVSSLVERADRSLYQAKNTGRNRVVSELDLKDGNTIVAA